MGLGKFLLTLCDVVLRYFVIYYLLLAEDAENTFGIVFSGGISHLGGTPNLSRRLCILNTKNNRKFLFPSKDSSYVLFLRMLGLFKNKSNSSN